MWQCTITIVEADSLIAADKSGTSDPFVKVGLVDAARSSFRKLFKTSAIQKTLAPKWEGDASATRTVSVPVGNDIALRVFDANRVGKPTPIGYARIDVPPPGTSNAERLNVDRWLALEGVLSGRVHVKAAFSWSADEDPSKVKKKTGKKLVHKLEKHLRIDIDGDGAVGVPAALDECARLRLENARLREELIRARQQGTPNGTAKEQKQEEQQTEPETTMAQPEGVSSDSREGTLAYNAEYNRFQLRRIQAEVVDTLKESVTRAVHTNQALTRAELEIKEAFWKRAGFVLAAGSVIVNWADYPGCPFGKEMRENHFLVNELFLNSASYGASPRAVLDAANRWRLVINGDPVTFNIKSRQVRLNEVASRVCDFIGADPNDFAWFQNANTATSTVFKSFVWSPGDRLLVFSCDYEATRLAAEWLTANNGVEIIDVPIVLPLTDDQILDEVEHALIHLKNNPPMPRLANFCHVTSRTAFVFPAAKLTKLFHKYKIPVCIDGAQVPGHIPLDINSIGAEYYIGTLHKWCYTIQGTAFLVAQPHVKSGLTPLTVSYFYGEGFAREFSYAGLLDFSPWLSAGEALDFVDKVCGGWRAVMKHGNDLAAEAVRILETAWGTKVFQGDAAHYGRMPIVPLPKGDTITDLVAKGIMAYLASAERITAFLPFVQIGGKRTLTARISCQIYNSADEVERLAAAISKLSVNNYSKLEMVTGVATAFLP